MNYLQNAKELVSLVSHASDDTKAEKIIKLAIAHAMIALVESIQDHTRVINTYLGFDVGTDRRLEQLERFQEHAEDDIEHLANRNPEVCNSCGKPMRYDFNSRWNCLNMSCKEYCDDIPF